ncbi:hypothetical protein D8674_027144 [Pyrus ussuriensis x Pyrus communis]|uniref:Uncharacterized protein n=1 Tax=Pyrus ussuriensis x Pyrus communis TaxID=2448454 RepID=A0A5N5IG64_9ROSA|nr:hypothetical protein D8674_027144 [Pyrus ussuriensis x Pyrus communis]
MPMSAHKMAEGRAVKGREKEALRAIKWGKETKSWRGGRNGIAEEREGWGKTRRKEKLEGRRDGLPSAPSCSKGHAAIVVANLEFLGKKGGPTDPIEFNEGKSLSYFSKLVSMAPSTTTSRGSSSNPTIFVWLNQAPETNRSLAALSALIIYIPPRVFSNCFQKIESWLLQTLTLHSPIGKKNTKKI